ncbi:MAG: 5-(carboxyamino)imidazole ribonucleotide synthase [Lysobacterales bacterium]
MSTIGILGGGQLARMLVLAGAPLGARFEVVDTVPDACAGQVASLLRADWRDVAALEKFAQAIDVATFDFENVPAETARWLAERVDVFPNPGALAVAQDRLAEKRMFREIGLGTADFAAVDDRAGLERAVAAIGLPAILKRRRLGYDGKGQALLRSTTDVGPAWLALGDAPLILEAFVPFSRELSLVAVRSRGGEFRTWPLTRNWHHNGILSASLAPAPDVASVAAKAVEHARALATRLDYVGVFALELFECNGRLLGNEMAPRVHNSGHWTIEGSECSQFENHVRAVVGWPLGSTAPRGTSVMLNWIGELPDRDPVLAEPFAHWHDYGKRARAGRKVGHATVCVNDPAELAKALERIGRALGREDQVAPVVAELRRA